MSELTAQITAEIRERWDPEFAFIRCDWAPWTPFTLPLHQAKVALVSTAGAHLKRWQAPFDTANLHGDNSFRELPGNLESEDLAFSHAHYDLSHAVADPNVVFPLERLRTLQHQGVIGAVAPLHYSFMGYNTRPAQLLSDSALHVAWRLRRANVDAVLVVAASPLCHQTAGLLARCLETAGLATLCLGVSQELMAHCQPPRSVVARSPFGAPLGEPGHAVKQVEVCKAALNAFTELERPGSFCELPYRWQQEG